MLADRVRMGSMMGFKPEKMQPISNLSVGAKVKSPDTKYNGVPIIWLIGHKTVDRAKLITISIPVLRGEVQQHPYVMPDSSIFQNTFSRIDYNPIMHSVHFLYKISKTLILCLVRVSHTFHVCL